MLLLCQIAFLCFRHVTVSAVVCFRLSICYIHSAVVTMISHELLLARPVGQYWHTVGVVDRNARGVVGCRRAGRVAGPAGQYGYILLGRHLVWSILMKLTGSWRSKVQDTTSVCGYEGIHISAEELKLHLLVCSYWNFCNCLCNDYKSFYDWKLLLPYCKQWTTLSQWWLLWFMWRLYDKYVTRYVDVDLNSLHVFSSPFDG